MLPTTSSSNSSEEWSAGDEAISGVSATSDEENSLRHGGWQVRLLLCLEDKKRTRTRLLVTEVLLGIITDIVNEIPGKVRFTRPKTKYTTCFSRWHPSR